jgi:hypothetical protein
MPYIGNTSADRFVAAKAATQFSGDGSTVAFTLEHSVGSDEDILVSVDGVVQEPSVAYAVSNGTTLTFTAAPSSNSGNNIFVYYLFRTVGTVSHPSNNALEATSATFSGDVTIPDKIIHSGDTNTAIRFPDADTVSFETGGSERARVDSNGSILVGTTSNDSANLGARMKSTGRVDATTNGGVCSIITRLSNDGTLVQFKKDTTTVGTIQSNGGVTIDIDGGGDRVGLAFTGDSLLPRKNGSLSDDTNNLGDGSRRFDNIHATNGTIQTSDRNEKQDIEELSDAEKRVAVVAKGLMRKFRWKSKVAKKGDKARTHFGIIAQDLEDAFKAEGLDASKYAMFCSDTWWEKEISVDAVEADEEKGIEAKDAYTYMDTKEEATEGYTKKTRLGVRYSELLAFIISAI